MENRRVSSALRSIVFSGVFFLSLFPTRMLAAPSDPDGCSQTKDLDRAIAACGELIRASPQEPLALVKRGTAYFLKYDYDRAYADFDEAVRRNAKEASAYLYRGTILQIKDHDDRAIADFTRALDLGLQDPFLLISRGNAHATQGDMTKAIADYSAEMRRDPKNVLPYFFRGIAYTYGGEFDKAQEDFKRGFAIDPSFSHLAIWLHIAERRANKPSTLASLVPQINMTKWPAPVVRMLLGQETPAVVLAIGEKNTAAIHYPACETEFYVAEYMYLQNRREEAIRHYKATLSSCRRIHLEWVAAVEALRSLGPAP